MNLNDNLINKIGVMIIPDQIRCLKMTYDSESLKIHMNLHDNLIQ